MQLSYILQKINQIRNRQYRERFHIISMAIVIASFVFILGITIIQSFFVSWNDYGNQIAKILSERMGASIIIKGSVEGALVPGHIALKDVHIIYKAKDGVDERNESSASIGTLYIKFNLFQILFKSTNVDRFTIADSVFNLSQLKNMQSAGAMHIFINNCALQIGNGVLVREIQKISGDLSLNDHMINADLAFVFNDDVYKVLISSGRPGKKSGPISARLDTDHMSIGFDGSGSTNEAGNYVLSGKLKGQGNNFIMALNKLTETNSSSFFEFYSFATDGYLLDSELSMSSAGINLNNFKLESTSLNGTMDMSYKFSTNEQSELNIHVSSIDLDVLRDKKASNIKGQKDNAISSMDFKVPDSISGFFAIKVDKLHSKGSQIENITIEGDISGGEVSIYEMSMLFPGESNVQIVGNLRSNQLRPRFDGNVHASGKDALKFLSFFSQYAVNQDFYQFTGSFDLRSKLILAPYIVSFVGLDFKTANNSLQGSARYKWSSSRQMVSANIDVGVLNLARVADSTKKLDLANSLSWLSNPMLRAKVELKAKELLLSKTETIRNPAFSLEMYDNNLVVKKIKLRSDKIDLRGDVRIIYNSVVPVIYAKLESRYLYLQPSKNYIFRKSDQGTGFAWANHNIDLTFLNDLRVQLDMTVDKLQYDRLIAENVVLNTEVINNNINVSNGQMAIAGGKLLFSGRVNIRKKKVVNMVFSLAEADVSKIGQLLGIGSFNQGLISASGSIVGSGNSIAEIMASTEGTMNVAIRNILVLGIDFDSFAANIIGVANKAEMMAVAEQSMYSGQTLFRSSDAKIIISKGVARLDATSLTNRTASALAANVDMSNLLMNGTIRIFFMLPGGKERFAVDMSVTGFAKYPVRAFNTDQLERLVFQGINPIGKKQ